MTTHADNIKKMADNYRAADAPSVSHSHRTKLHATIDALQAERDMYKATAEAIVCVHCDAKHQAQAAEIVLLQGEATVLRGLLKECANLIATIDCETQEDHDCMVTLQERIVGVL